MKNPSLGSKIKRFRTQRNLSQLQLENEIDASPGSISRIESNKTNPTKETLIDIAYALKIDTSEIASLFGIEFPQLNDLIDLTNEVSLNLNVNEVVDKVVNNLVLKMGYIASAVFLIKGDKLYTRGITYSNISSKFMRYIPNGNVSFMRFKIDNHPENLIVKAIKENKPQLTNISRDYIVPLLPVPIANWIQKITGDKSSLLMPLTPNGRPIGAIVYTKKFTDDFSRDMKNLEIFTKQIAIAIQNAMRHEKLKEEVVKLKNEK